MVVIGSSAPASGLHERADVVQGAGVEGQQIVVGLKVRPELGRGVERGLRVKMCVWLGVSRGLDLAFLNAD